MSWLRVKNTTPYVKAEQYSEEFGLVKRLYCEDGKKYPLLGIAIYGNFSHDPPKYKGIKIDISYKKAKNDWWDGNSFNEDSFIPLELFDDLREMLKEAEEKIKQYQAVQASNASL